MHCCELHDCMPPSKPIARLVSVCQKEQVASFDKRQIPINVDDNFIMKLQFDDSCMNCDHHHCTDINMKSKTYKTFLAHYQKLTFDELTETLRVPSIQIKDYVLRCVPCIGCRTSIENFMKSLIEHRHPGLEPLLVTEQGLLTIKQIYLSNPEHIYALFYIHGSKLNRLIENIPKSKKNRRCTIHSLDKSKSINDWEFVWDAMNKECRDETILVEADGLLETLENYLRKHKFCSECKLKVLEAYDLLLDDNDEQHKHRDRKGFCPALYDGLRCCANDKHIHVQTDKNFVRNLILRAEPEIHESRRERHAKTLDIAQEEILTCIGIYLFERFDKIFRTMRSEEQTWQLLFYIGIDCLRRNFETAVDGKQDFSTTLESLCEEFRLADEEKILKKQQRRSKRKARRQTKAQEEETIDHIPQEVILNNKENLPLIRRRTHSCCYDFCHYCDEQVCHLSSMPGKLIKSHSCPSSLLLISKSNSHLIVNLSSSLETLFSSVSTRECPQALCDECPTSSSIPCMRCFSTEITRTDPGYSSGQEDTCSFGPCECRISTCDVCLTESIHSCPLHEENESNDDSNSSALTSPCNSILSSDIYRHKCYIHETLSDCPKIIELCDATRKCKLKLQLCQQHPFFNMDLKQVWDENVAIDMEKSYENSFISDDDLRQFYKLNINMQQTRIKLRQFYLSRFTAWQNAMGRLPY